MVSTSTILLPPSMPHRTRRELSRYVLDSFEASGVHAPPSSRLGKMNRIYLEAKSIIARQDPNYEIAVEAERDMQLLAFAFDQFVPKERTPAFKQILKRIVSDSPLPQQDRGNSPGRDAAFELYVGAVCRSGRFVPVAFEEPDVTCVWQSIKYAFAAKRIKSESKIIERVSVATKQIKRSGLPGVIALDTCLAFNPGNLRMRQMPDAVFWSEYFQNLRATWSEYQPKIQNIIARADVLGIVVHDYLIREQPNNQISLAGMTMRVPSIARTSDDQRHFETLSTLYTYSLPNQDDVSNLPTLLSR